MYISLVNRTRFLTFETHVKKIFLCCTDSQLQLEKVKAINVD